MLVLGLGVLGLGVVKSNAAFYHTPSIHPDPQQMQPPEGSEDVGLAVSGNNILSLFKMLRIF